MSEARAFFRERDVVGWLIKPLDEARAALYRLAAPLLRDLYADRERRVLWLGAFSVFTSFVFTALVPLWLLSLGPIILGVPHLLSDVRYLVVRPALHRRWAFWCSMPALVAVGVGAPPAVGLLAMLPAAFSARARSLGARGLVLMVGAALVLVAARWELPFITGMVHLHNVIAVGLWLVLRQRGPAGLATVGLIGTVGVFVLCGGADGLVTLAGGWEASATGNRLDDFVASTAPGLSGPWAVRLVLSFAFMQSVHYGVWLRLVPDDLRQRAAPRPFKASWAALRAELGLWPVCAFTLLALGIAIWGAMDLHQARLGYLRLGAFHGYLELAVLAFFAVERRA